MAQIGTVAVILLFSIGFMLWLGSGGLYGLGFLNLIGQLMGMSPSTAVNFAVTPIVAISVASAVGLGTILSFANSQSVTYAISVAVVTGVGTILFLPFTFVSEISGIIPLELYYLLTGFFTLLIIIAVISFVMGRDF